MRAPPFALLALGSLAVLTACASSSGSRGPTRGLFDGEDDGNYAGAPPSSGYAEGYAEEAEPASPMEPPADDGGVSITLQDRIAVGGASGVSRERTPGFFDELLSGDMTKSAEPETVARASPMNPAPAKPEAKPVADAGGPKPVSAASKRLMIYTGNATVLVPGVDVAVQKLIERVEGIGGYLEAKNGDTSANTTTITLRIPAAEFFTIQKELGTYGQVLNQSVQAQDVTKQVFDLEIRLDNATQARGRLIELLKQAQKMEDILQIEAEIRRLTDEIELMKGQLATLKDRIAFSTLTVSFYSNAPPPVTGPRRTYSRFDWINRVGPERVIDEF